jgi:hypothetical protein
MTVGWRIVLSPVFALAMLWVGVTGDLAGWLPTGFWNGRTQEEAGFHSIVALVTFALMFILFAGSGNQGTKMREQDLYAAWPPYCGGCEHRRQIIAAYVAPVRKTNWWAAAGWFSVVGIIMLIAHAIHS